MRIEFRAFSSAWPTNMAEPVIKIPFSNHMWLFNHSQVPLSNTRFALNVKNSGVV